MIRVRRAEQRGQADHGWLSAYHTFSFAGFHDPSYMGFRSLRVMNEDRVQPGNGFRTHPHQDMEIVTYVLDGAIEHRDSMGDGAVLRPGEFQRISAGTGIEHSEFNPSDTEMLHLYSHECRGQQVSNFNDDGSLREERRQQGIEGLGRSLAKMLSMLSA